MLTAKNQINKFCNVLNLSFINYNDIFSDELGTFNGPPVKFELKPDAHPIKLPPRKIPFALREKVEQELDRLQKLKIIEPIAYSDWLTPIVPVLKGDGKIRICGDYRSTLNKMIKTHTHQIPSVESLLSKLDQGKIFAKLDLTNAYLQLSVDEETAKMQTIITTKGAFKCNRLQFAISATPGIFQSLIEEKFMEFPDI